MPRADRGFEVDPLDLEAQKVPIVAVERWLEDGSTWGIAGSKAWQARCHETVPGSHFSTPGGIP